MGKKESNIRKTQTEERKSRREKGEGGEREGDWERGIHHYGHSSGYSEAPIHP